MAVLSPSRLANVLTRRSRATVAGFVEACYDARGWTVTASGDGFEATNPRTGDTERVAVLGARTRLTAPGRVDADVVVARRDAPWARAVATASDARFLGPAELRDVLLYGVGRDRARELLAEHLGASLERSPARVRAETLAVAVALLVVVAGTAGGVATLVEREAAADPGSAATTPVEPTETPESGRPEPNTVSQFPAGVNDNGVQDVRRLAEAHSVAIDGQSYSLHIEGRQSVGNGEGRWEVVRRNVTVENRMQYRVAVASTGADNDTDVRYEAFADGQRVVTRTFGADGGPVYASRPILPERESPFTRVATSFILRYLDTNESDLSLVVYRGRGVYLVSAVGDPERLPGNVSDYEAVAILYPNGFLAELEARYNVTSDGRTRRIEARFVYDDVGETSVTRPTWTDALDDNGTATPVGPD
jgi:hypothetical protein